jgi:hypothetical protein
MEQLVTNVTKLIPRKDGSEVKLVARAYFGAGLHRSVGIDVFRRASPAQAWQLCSDRPHPDWRTMSVEDYIRHGRSESLQAATPSEILCVTALIGRALSSLPADIKVA